jgi:ATP-dependent Lon protease
LSDAVGTSEFSGVKNTEPDEHGLIECPVVSLKGVVIYPGIIIPLTISAENDMRAVKVALDSHRTAIAIAMRDPSEREPSGDDLFAMGTEIALGHFLPLPGNMGNVLAQGRRRVKIVNVIQDETFLRAQVLPLAETRPTDKTPGMVEVVIDLFKKMAELSDTIPDEVLDYTISTDDPGLLADLIASTLPLPLKDHQQILEIPEIDERLQHIALLLGRQISMLEMKEEINNQIQDEISRGQREMYLREQMRIIQMELGEDDIFQQEMNELRDKILSAQMPDEVSEKAMKELSRLAIMPPMAPEVGIIHTYIEWLTELPWTEQSEDNLDIDHVERVLDEDHYGLPKVKDRILEHIAVRKLAADKMKSPILCFLGPPGVGKTSLGKSIARALGREFARVSLGGVRDEAEIRGHRRTYIGALPGRIIQTMRRLHTINPVFMLDEIDKLGTDFHGDPASALLEVLDPEQNYAFLDHYLDVPYDLSKVLFITTANDLYPLPAALEDRLEVIEFAGYIEEDKLAIARQFLIPKQLEAHGLTGISFETRTLETIIRQYTYEAGVRNLERELANICRKVARSVASGKHSPKRITPQRTNEYLGPPGYIAPRANTEDSVGVATGLVWTSAGGDIQTIEVAIVPGKGTVTMTGQLGEVLQESAQAAMSYMRAHASELDVPDEDFENFDVHVHMPEGAVPKDGPSAGITLAAALISAFTERKIRSDFAMTGEITLRGKVLPVGGIKEKVLAARRARIPNVILPDQNSKDLVDVPKKALSDLTITLVDDMEQVLELVMGDLPPEGRKREKAQPDDEQQDNPSEK